MRARRLAAAILLLGLAASCAHPVGVRRVSGETAYRALTGNVLSEGTPSAFSRTPLLRLGLWNTYREDPDAALAALRASLGGPFENARLFALAELSFHQGREQTDARHYLAAALYAWAFLFPESGAAPTRYDARVRIALDLYNRGLAEGLRTGEGDTVALDPGVYRLPFGTLELTRDPRGMRWADRRFVRFVDLGRFEVRGLRNRYRRPGVGAALAGEVEPLPSQEQRPALRIGPALRVPVTAIVHVDAPRAAVRSERVRGRLQVFAEDVVPSVTIAGREVPLEFDTSAALAYTLDRAQLWSFGTRGFLSGEFRADTVGLYAITPYHPGRVPVVLVHGTTSSPVTFAQLLNELRGDPFLNSRCQFWLFLYNTGNPILYSAARLRSDLRRAVAELDPEGDDPGLRRMVVIGHSQGGLLTRLQVTGSGSRFWDMVARKPLDALALRDDTRALLREAFFFEPVDAVTRVVFISTPHAGSTFAAGRIGRLGSRLIRMPFRLAGLAGDLLVANQDALVVQRTRITTSVDNMEPGSPFSETLSSSAIAPGVAVHSIVAIRGEDGPPFDGLGDGVVAFESAHLPEADSEIVVRSGHSAQQQPQAIEEVRRILRLHVRGPDDTEEVGPPAPDPAPGAPNR